MLTGQFARAESVGTAPGSRWAYLPAQSEIPWAGNYRAGRRPQPHPVRLGNPGGLVSHCAALFLRGPVGVP